MHTKITIVGIPWYEPSSYQQVTALMEDGHNLPATFEHFLVQAVSAENRLKGKGYRVVRAVIRPGDFEAWCRSRGLNVNSDGRKQFASWTAAQVHTHGN